MLITASAIAFSLAGLFTRLIDLDVWTVLFWRALFGGISFLETEKMGPFDIGQRREH